MKLLVSILLIVLVLALTACTAKNYDSFAQCLTDNNVKFYGARWCPHCVAQKEDFGPSIDRINYIECAIGTTPQSGQTEICKRDQIESYPTWEFSDGERLTGQVPFETLAQKTGCVLP